MIFISDILKLEEITLDNHSELFELMERIYRPSYKHLWINEDCSWYLNKCYGLSNLKQELKNKDARYFFVVYNSEKIGILRYILNQNLKDFTNQPTTYLHRIYLSKKAQGKGIGQQLLNWVEKQAVKDSHYHLYLEAMDTQQQALNFYKNQGFKEIARFELDFIRIHEQLRGMLILHKRIV
jgi:GNAT superfamily N-acetyltransferase